MTDVRSPENGRHGSPRLGRPASTSLGRDLVERARAQLGEGDNRGAMRTLRQVALVDDSARAWIAGVQLLRKARAVDEARRERCVRVALIGTSTLDPLGELLELAGLIPNLDLQVWVGGFGQYESLVMDPASSLYVAQPDVILFAPDASAAAIPALTDDPEVVLGEQLDRWTGVWNAAQQHSDAHLVQVGFVPPFERPLGSLEGAVPGGRRAVFTELNRRLAAAAGSTVRFVDAGAIASDLGLGRWYDDRYWFHAKQAVSMGALPLLARAVASSIGALLGRSRKVLVVDLDDTLWGGIVGEDGVENLLLEGDAVGEAHVALQSYLVDLRRRGVLLAVCSKNDADVARAPFVQRRDMRLGMEDLTAFVANWEPKPDNIRRIAEQLGLGLDAFVFLDDNPAERELVRQRLPDVDVLELPPEPSGYLRCVATYPGFEAAALTAEDGARTEQYRARAAAEEFRQRATSLDDYLTSLEMHAEVEPFSELTLPRVAQLVAKTNQWNLTTRRHSMETLRGFADDPNVVTASLRLHDRFADHGIVAVVIAIPRDDVLDIDTLLMSCRVIGRTVERTLVHEVAEAARSHGLRAVRATYVPTPRNSLVADIADVLGFTPVGGRDEETLWELDLRDAASAPPNPFIRKGP